MSQTQVPSVTAAANLVGAELPGGWTIVEQIPRPGNAGAEDQTGSWFSIGYIATDGKKKAFVKVIDVQRALESSPGVPLIERLRRLTESHTFECAILDICGKARLDRIVRVLSKGELPPPAGSVPAVEIPFIMFELADGDVRKVVSRANKVEDAWRFRVLHDVAVGIQQLHSQSIAHQDLKPSNVLIFDDDGKGAKIGDLGRASRRGLDAAHDGMAIAGARNYAPPEQVFGVVAERWEDRREGCDLYHLGSLATFLFAGVTPAVHFARTLPDEVKPVLWGGKGLSDYQSALPLLSSTFARFIDSIRKDLPPWAEPELTQILLNACNPDYSKRGDPAARRQVGGAIGIATFVSRFDRLAKRAIVESRE